MHVSKLVEAELITRTDSKGNEFEFKRLLKFIKFYELAKITENDTIGDSVETNLNTRNFKNQGGFAKLHEKQQYKINKENRLNVIKDNKLENDAKLSKWQAKTFWCVFSFGIIGGVYAIISMVIALTGETTEQKIQHILEDKFKSQPKIENTSIPQTNNKIQIVK